MAILRWIIALTGAGIAFGIVFAIAMWYEAAERRRERATLRTQRQAKAIRRNLARGMRQRPWMN